MSAPQLKERERRKKDYLREREVAAEYPPSRGLLRKWRREGIGPNFIKLEGRMIVYERRAIEEYLASHTVRTRERAVPPAAECAAAQ